MLLFTHSDVHFLSFFKEVDTLRIRKLKSHEIELGQMELVEVVEVRLKIAV